MSMNSSDQKVALESSGEIDLDGIGSAVVTNVVFKPAEGRTATLPGMVKGKRFIKAFAIRENTPGMLTMTIYNSAESKEIIKWVKDNKGRDPKTIERKQMTWTSQDDGGDEVKEIDYEDVFPYTISQETYDPGSNNVATLTVEFSAIESQ